MSGAVTELLPIPGCETPLVFERTEDGRLLRLSAGERVYVDATQDGRTQYDGLANVDTIFLPAGFVRHVETRGERWSERHAWDDIGRITHADGTDMDYDEEGRIIACRGPGGDWHYGYAGPHLTVISGPFGLRHIIRADDGRPVAWRGDDGCGTIHYDDTGRRIGLPAKPGEWCVDGRGRLLAITDDAGRITRTLLWDRWHCLGALDGPPGSPMLEAYLLDATGTPVRRVTADGAERLPRDAFGEMLLRKGGPGLFGGAIRDGMVHLPLRRLDPITGSFDAPDPINGEAADPRRATGWTGPLPVELPAAGPYAVCRNNPVSLADPTGGISDLWWLIPSSLTWSISNTIGSLLGMWLNLQFSPIGWIVSKATNHDPFDLEWVTANNYDSFALRTDGFLAAPTHAFTYQFMMSADKKQMTDLEDARLFAPSAAFRPVLYGSVLRCVPDGTGAFLLSGQRAAPNGASLVTWTRAGGAAEPVFPGSRVPVFPAGGMHFDAVQLEIKPRPATMTELAPSGVVLTATIGDFAGLTLSGTGLGLTIGAAFALTDPAGILSAGRVLAVHEASGSTIVRTDADLTGLAAGPLTLDGLTAPSSEPLTPVPGRNQLLDITGSSLDYVPAVSVVRLSRGGPPLGAAGVSALAAGIVVDEPVPTMLAPGTPVRTAMAGGVFNGTLGPNPNDLTIVSGAVPAVGDAIVAGPAATGIAAIVTAVAASVITLDRALTPLGATGAAANWAQLAAGAEIGRLTQAPDGTATLTYAPGLPGTAPATGFVMLNGATTVARRVTSRVFDAIVLAEVLPDANPAAFTVERFKRTAPNVTNVMAASIATIALSAAPPAGVAAFQIIPFAAAAPATSGTLLAGATLAGGVASSSIAPGSGNPALRPGEAVAAVPPGGAAAVPVQITSVRLTVTFDRRVPMGAGAIEAALLALDALVYPADRVDDRILRVQPPLAGSVRLDMPRFAVGDLVVVNWPGGNQRLFTLTAVSGTTITGDTDDAVIPAGTTGITVTRLVVADPATGSSRLGINGTDAGGRQIAFDVWSPRHFGGGVIVALINGPLVRAARVDGANQPLALRLAGAAALAGSHNIASWGGTAQFAANFTIDGAVLTVTDIDVVNALTGMAGALVMPWSPGAATTTGQMLPGSVRVPEDHENASLELTRYQAVIDHELTHTLQSAKWGPLLLTAVPLWGLELGADLSAAGGPEFSPYGDATLGEGRLTFAQGAGIAANDKVQVAQNRRAVLIDLGPTVDGAVASLPDQARADLSAANITAGPVKVRKALQGTGSDVLEMFINISKFLTVGGLLNNITLASWGGIAALVTLAVQGIRSATRSRAVMSLAADRKTLTLSPAAPLDGLRSGALVAVKSGDAIVIRAIESLTDTTAVLGAPTPQFTTGTPAPLDVEISLYTPGSALFGLRDYFTAAMPDSNQPARLLFSGAGGRPTLAVHDRIDIRGVSGASQRTLVTLVDGDAIEFADPLLPANSGTNEFLVAKITSEDRTGWLDSWLLDELNIGWMQYIYDPWGHVIAEHIFLYYFYIL